MTADPDVITPHEETREFRYFGPPGTGKTTTMARQIHRGAQRFGSDRLLVTSFSRAAAAELAGRGLELPRDRLGTLHSHCYRAFDQPGLAEIDGVGDWNRRNPTLALTPSGRGRIDGEERMGAEEEAGGSSRYPGDQFLELANRYRGEMIPPGELWTEEANAFYSRWTAFKRETGMMDFTDLIGNACDEFRFAPGLPRVMYVDEAQDLTPLQLKLIRQWGSNTEYFIVAGDDDQILYSWCGCRAEALLNPPLPEESVRVLAQSWRLPRAVHRVAVRWIEMVKHRQPKTYLPRDEEGRASIAPYTFSDTQEILALIEPHLTSGQSVMLLASCAYMLEPLRKALREAAIPFHNPYRRQNGNWNPLRHSKGSASSRVLSLLAVHPQYEDARRWQRSDLRLITEWMSATLLQRGVKTRLLRAGEQELMVPVDARELVSTFSPGVLDALMEALELGPQELGDWWLRGLNTDFHRRAGYPLQIAVERGREALVETPQVVLGTIHSVKGGEADVVVLFPEMSKEGWSQVWTPEGVDACRRLFYVGMTRARRVLYLAAANSQTAVSWDALPVDRRHGG